MRRITEAEVARAIDMREAIASMNSAFTQFGQGAGAVLPRSRANAEHAGAAIMVSAMGAALPAAGVCGTKVYSTVAGKFEFVIVLWDAKSGKPLATIESNELTRLRTGAATAVACQALARSDARTLALFGAGTLAKAHVEAFLLVHPFKEILVCARSGAAELAAALSAAHGVTARAVDAATAAATADVIVTCTRATDPLFDGALVKPGTLVCAVGSSKPVARELDDTLLARADRIVVEWQAAARAEAGEFVRAAAGDIRDDKVIELGQVLAQGIKPGAQEIVVYKSVGIGLEDVALAKLVFDRVK